MRNLDAAQLKHSEEMKKAVNDGTARKSWLKQIGIAGFLFFLIKGLMWLLIPYLVSLGLGK